MVSSVLFVRVFRRQRPEPVILVELQQGVGIFLFNLGSTDRLVPWWEGRLQRNTRCLWVPGSTAARARTWGHKPLQSAPQLSTTRAVTPGTIPSPGFWRFPATRCTAIHSIALWNSRDLSTGRKPRAKLEGMPVQSEGESSKNKEEEGSNYMSGDRQEL